MRKTERIVLQAVNDNILLIIRLQEVVMSTISQINEIVAEINLTDARLEMLEKQQ